MNVKLYIFSHIFIKWYTLLIVKDFAKAVEANAFIMAIQYLFCKLFQNTFVASFSRKIEMKKNLKPNKFKNGIEYNLRDIIKKFSNLKKKLRINQKEELMISSQRSVYA